MALCISDNEDAEAYKDFVNAVKKYSSCELSYIMIDKSKAEMAACGALGITFLLCKFHMFQDVERFCKSSKSGVNGAERKWIRVEIYRALRNLQVSSYFFLNLLFCPHVSVFFAFFLLHFCSFLS